MRLDKVRQAAEQGVREEPWVSPELRGARRVRAVLAGKEDEIRARYVGGETCLGLAQEYGIPESTMRNYFRRVGIEMRPQGMFSPEQVIEMVRLREAGWTYQAIGEKFGVTRVAVKRRIMGQ